MRIIVNGRFEQVLYAVDELGLDEDFKITKKPIVYSVDEESASSGIKTEMTETPLEYIVPLPSELNWEDSAWCQGYLNGMSQGY